MGVQIEMEQDGIATRNGRWGTGESWECNVMVQGKWKKKWKWFMKKGTELQ